MSMKTYSNENSFVIYLVPPLYIHIQGLNHPLTSGVKVHLSCSTAGARPIPQIVWTKGSQVMQGASQTVCSEKIAKIIVNFTCELFPNWLFPQTSANGNITTSDIVYLPTPEDNTKVIACSVPVEEKNNAPTLSIKDTRILDIKRKRPLTLPLHFKSIIGQFSLAHRRSHRDAVVGLEFRSQESSQRHRCLSWMSDPSQSTNQEDWVVS